jgi:hypothetical protein
MSADLEILDSMPYKATVYRKKDGKWERCNVKGWTPLTVHIVGKVEYQDGKDTACLSIYHRFIGKTFPQYAASRGNCHRRL